MGLLRKKDYGPYTLDLGVFLLSLKIGPLNKRLLDLPLHTPAFSSFARYLFSSLYSGGLFLWVVEMCSFGGFWRGMDEADICPI